MVGMEIVFSVTFSEVETRWAAVGPTHYVPSSKLIDRIDEAFKGVWVGGDSLEVVYRFTGGRESDARIQVGEFGRLNRGRLINRGLELAARQLGWSLAELESVVIRYELVESRFNREGDR